MNRKGGVGVGRGAAGTVACTTPWAWAAEAIAGIPQVSWPITSTVVTAVAMAAKRLAPRRDGAADEALRESLRPA